MNAYSARWIVGFLWILVLVLAVPACQEAPRERPEAESEEAGPRSQPGTEMSIYSPEQHDRYTGRFVLEADRIYQVGTFEDPPGWDHMGNDAENLRLVVGTARIDVNEIENTGSFVAKLDLPEGELLLEIQRFHEFSPCQDGGIAAYIFEHGDSGCGDSNWPKSFLYVAGWGYGRATLNGESLYQDYQMHFMVTQGMRNRETLKIDYPILDKKGAAGEVDPAAQQLDFYIRSPERDEQNNPARKVFDHFFAMEVTWK